MEETTSKTFQFFLQNIRFLPRNFEEFELEIEQLAQRPDIICLSETWLKINLTMIFSKFKDTNLSIVALELNEEEVLASMLTLGQIIG